MNPSSTTHTVAELGPSDTGCLPATSGALAWAFVLALALALVLGFALILALIFARALVLWSPQAVASGAPLVTRRTTALGRGTAPAGR